MTQQELLQPVPFEKLETLSKEDLLILLQGERSIRHQLEKDNDRLRALNSELEQKQFYIEEQYITVKSKLFGKSSEKQPSEKDKRDFQNRQRKKKKKIQLPSLRYPDLPLIEKIVSMDPPKCPCCESQMRDSGLSEKSEYLTKVPAQYYVVRLIRPKFRCGSCQSALVTAPAPPRIKPRGSYSDELIVDVALNKYCDLIPMERQAEIAKRAGVMDLPPQSLIEQTHHLANFMEPAYDLIKSELMEERVLHADETPHRMLEQNDEKKSWYLWGFSSLRSCYFEVHDTRSGDVASEILNNSECEFLVSDVFSGYGKAVRQSNQLRQDTSLPEIKNVYCNAHARRKFKEALSSFPNEAEFYIAIYGKIYRLTKMSKKWPHKKKRLRRLMEPLFEKIKTQAMSDVGGYSSKSSIGKAMNYFLNNYESLILFLNHLELPIDNNSQERLLRNPVIGRKTWYGNHSKRGARTTAILFSLVESCKLNNVNPRAYFKKLVEDLHQGKKPYTPNTYANLTG